MIAYLLAAWDVLLGLAPWLLLGAAMGGVLHVMLPPDFLRRQLTGRGSVAKAVGLGVPLPLCSCGVIPVGMQLKNSGASSGAVVAFLTSTPQTGADSILVSASMLGWPFAIFKLFSAVVTGLVGGWLTDWFDVSPKAEANVPELPRVEACSQLLPIVEVSPPEPQRGFRDVIFHAIDLIRSIWGWLAIGVLVSAAITALLPTNGLEDFASFGTLPAMLISVVISAPLYVCATASVPIAAALVASGLPAGAALVFLMAGPATNTATLGAVYRTLGGRVLGVYLSTIVVGSIVCGWTFESVLPASTATARMPHEMNQWWSIASAALLCVLLAYFAGLDLVRLFRKGRSKHSAFGQQPSS